MIIREIRAEDAASYLTMLRALDGEAEYMMLEPGERKVTVEEEKRIITEYINSPNSTIFVVEEDSRIVGFVAAEGGGFRRNRHSAYLVAGLLSDYTGHGLGTKLFERIKQWAVSEGLHRLELTVVCANEAALRLYTKQGFKIEGVKKDSLLIAGKYVDEYYMGLVLT